MTREQEKQLQKLNTDVLRVSLILTQLLQNLAEIDAARAVESLEGMTLSLRTTIGQVDARKKLKARDDAREI